MKIVRILKVVDTRQYEEGPDDRWYPIPNSGIDHVCERCGRMHEVHAQVQLEDGAVATVGTGCAGKDDSVLAAKFKTADRLAKRLARLNAEKAAFEEAAAAWDRAYAEVLKLPVPSVTTEKLSDTRLKFAVGSEGQAFAFINPSTDLNPQYREERIRCAVEGWRSARMLEAGQPRFRPFSYRDFSRERARIEKALASVTDSTAACVQA